jgi:hypothetical protein
MSLPQQTVIKIALAWQQREDLGIKLTCSKPCPFLQPPSVLSTPLRENSQSTSQATVSSDVIFTATIISYLSGMAT